MSVLAEISRELSSLAARAAPAVAGLEQGHGQGSATVLSPDGYLLTNAHVVPADAPLRVRLFGGATTPARVVGRDVRTDLAVVQAEARGLSPLALSDTRTLQVGQLVVAIGNPLGFERSVSLGVVSALFRNLPTRAGGLEGLIQTDAAVNPGNSGGPLLDVEGRVVGINTAMVPFARGIGFAVPAQTATWVAAVLLQHGEVRRPYIGIVARGEELAGEALRAAGQARAVRILRVEPSTPAAASGLQGDDLLLAANRNPIDTLDDLQRALVLAADPEVGLEVLRAGHRRSLSVRPRPRAA
jgi:S1-C subfamily serine protease